MNELGPVMLNLGSMRQTSIGRATAMVTLVMGILAALFVAVIVIVAIIGSLFADLLLAVILAAIPLLIGLSVVAFAITMWIQLDRTTAQVHANGLALGQSWFRKAQIPWDQVVRIDPPTSGSTWIRCDVVLRSGRRICADRLRLKPVVGATGHYVNHFDVQAVLDHYGAWQQAHGRAAP